MVWVRNMGMKPAYVCDYCGHSYRNPKTAIECESFCKKTGRPCPEITGKAFSGP